MTILRTTNLVFLTCIALSGCNQGTQSPSVPPVQKVPDLSREVSKLQHDFELLDLRVRSLESKEAIVSTEEQGYGIAKTNFGAFTVSVKTVTPYLDGFKVKLTIGNVTSADFNGAKLNVSWGPPFDTTNPIESIKKMKEKEFSITNKFSSGAFSDVEVALTPAKPDEVKTLNVGIQVDQLSLRVR
jgi:hypothetical protein